MARRRKQGGSIYLSTNPENNVPIGVKGKGTSIGRMGTWIYGRGDAAQTESGLIVDFTDLILDLTTMQVALE